MRQFADRAEAGRALAALLDRSGHGGTDAVVLGLPRGGVPVAAPVAGTLHLPLDVLLVRKLGHPRQPELAIGALGEGGVVVWNDDLAHGPGLTDDVRESIRQRACEQLDESIARYRTTALPPVRLAGRTAIVVDDGIATGATARAAIAVARARGARAIVLATPVIARETFDDFAPDVDELCAVQVVDDLGWVGRYYRDFTPTSDADVTWLLRHAIRS